MLDVDVCGPSIPVVMGLEGEQVHQSGSGWSPVVRKNLLMFVGPSLYSQLMCKTLVLLVFQIHSHELLYVG